jgi:hypothetical protein
MPTRKQLNQRHPSFDADKSARLRALYEGGELFKAKLDEFLPQQPAEPPVQYALRKKISVYRNYVGPISDYFTALLFASAPIITGKTKGAEAAEVQLPDYYSRFEKDCDRAGTNLIDAFKEMLSDAMIVQRAWLWLQHEPDGQMQPSNRADFEKLGLGDSWVRVVKDEQVLDWETDDTGNLALVIIFDQTAKRTSLSVGRDTIVETWHCVLADRVDVYQLSYERDKPPGPDAEVPLRESYKHRYGAVPIVCLDMPPALWVGSRIESPQLAHFRLSNMQLWGMSRTCYAMPVFKRDSEEKDEPRMGAGYGIYLGLKESLEWAAPPVDCYGALGEEIKSHKDEIYRIANTMALGVENNSAAVGRSGESKNADARSTTVVMQAFARRVRECIERVYDLIGRARGDKYQWAVAGLDDFSADDLPGMVEMFKTVNDAGGIASQTFNVEMQARLAESFLPDLDQQTKQTIRKELQAGVPDPVEEREDEKKAALELFKKPGSTERPGQAGASPQFGKPTQPAA